MCCQALYSFFAIIVFIFNSFLHYLLDKTDFTTANDYFINLVKNPEIKDCKLQNEAEIPGLRPYNIDFRIKSVTKLV